MLLMPGDTPLLNVCILNLPVVRVDARGRSACVR
jgi:hypothetical protein